MKKQQVKSINTVVQAYVHVDSKFGSGKNTTHPFHKRYSIKAVCKLTDGIKEGDIIRCDGIPYQSRPRYLLDREGFRLYSPFKLGSGLWVLRKD